MREFTTWTARELGIELPFTGQGVEEIVTVAAVTSDMAPAVKLGDVVMRTYPRYFRPAEVDTLLGDPTKAREQLGWVPKITAQEMCAEMVAENLRTERRHAHMKAHDMDLPVSFET